MVASAVVDPVPTMLMVAVFMVAVVSFGEAV